VSLSPLLLHFNQIILFSSLVLPKSDSFAFDNRYTQNPFMTDTNQAYHDYSNPFGSLLGLHFSEWHQGRSLCHIDITSLFLNPNGVVHGAVIYALADTGMGGALVSILDQDELCTTVEIKMSYFRSITTGQLRCEARVIQRGKRIAFLDALVYSGDTLIAQATGTFAIGMAKPAYSE
jgi:acyl-CoA thioesterase